MDFVKLLKSFEELLYEVMALLVFVPRTFYLTLRYPQRMMDYADTELGDVSQSLLQIAAPRAWSMALSTTLLGSVVLISTLILALLALGGGDLLA